MDFNNIDVNLLATAKNKFAPAQIEKAKAKSNISRLAIKDKSHFTVNGMPITDAEGKPVATVKALFVGHNPHMSKQYFSDDNKLECYSNNSITPASDCKAPQSPRCGQCVKSMYGSATAFGRKAKACNDVRKVAVVLSNPATGEWDKDVTYLNLTTTSNSDFDASKKYAEKSWFAFEQYLEHLHTQAPDMPPQLFVMNLHVCTEEAYNMMKFQPIVVTTQEEFELVSKINEKPLVARMLGTNETPQTDVAINTIENKPPVTINTDLTQADENALEAALNDLGI